LESFAKMNGDFCSTKENFKLLDVVLDTKKYVKQLFRISVI